MVMSPQTKKAMKQIQRKLYIAALAIVGAMAVGCTGVLEEIPEQVGNDDIPVVRGETVTLTTTISLGESAGTKALDASGVKTFAVDDRIAVVYEDVDGYTQKAVSVALTAENIREEGKKADITVSLTDPAQNGALRYIYPAAMAKATIATDATIDDAGTIDFTRLDAQDGTLASLAANLDLAVFDGNYTAAAELPASATLENRLTIGEFTIKNYGGSDISNTITGLIVDDGTNTYTVTRDAVAGPIYVAMIPVADADIEFTASDGENTFIKNVTDKTLAANKMYPIGLRMSKLITLTSETGALELSNGDILTGTGGADTHVTIANGATVTLQDVTINSIDSGNAWAGITCAGDASIIIEGTNTVKGSNNFNAGVHVPGDKDDSSNNKTLTIDGPGTLNASSYNGAGIGGGFTTRYGGNIVINGGTINASSHYGACIGAGQESRCGDITINGGTVIAQNTATNIGGTGIGSGGSNSASSRCGDISITGGTVEATTVGQGAAIGTGCSIKDNSCGSISITGGTVVAMAFFYGASAIGTGELGEGTQTCGTITIGSGITSVSAVTNGTPVGPSYGSTCGTVTIDGHVMTSAELTTPTYSNTNLPNLQWANSTVRDPEDSDDVPKWTLTRKP